MKFKITLTPSNYYQDAKKSKYLNPVIVESLEDFKKVILKDYACAVYKNNHRSIDDFLYADAIVFDIDNDHSENPDDWMTPNKVSSFFSDVPIYIQYSRNHMKIKNDKPARPKFHIIFPIDKVKDAKEYRALKEKVYSIFPFVDGQALITIHPQDTNHLRFTSYVYDIQLTKENGSVKTIITPSHLTITGEVTYD